MDGQKLCVKEQNKCHGMKLGLEGGPEALQWVHMASRATFVL